MVINTCLLERYLHTCSKRQNYLARDTDGLVGRSLDDDLVGAFGALGNAVAAENGIAYSDENVVHAVQLDVLDATLEKKRTRGKHLIEHVVNRYL